MAELYLVSFIQVEDLAMTLTAFSGLYQDDLVKYCRGLYSALMFHIMPHSNPDCPVIFLSLTIGAPRFFIGTYGTYSPGTNHTARFWYWCATKVNVPFFRLKNAQVQVQ